MIAFCSALFFIIELCDAQGPSMEEEFVLNFDSPVYVCPDEVSQAFVDTSGLEVVRHNETVSMLNGSFRFLKTLESCTLLEMIVEKNCNGRVDVMVTHEICDLCDEVGENSIYYKYLKFMTIHAGCPFKGDYEITQFVVNSEDFPLIRANEARYQVTLNFYKNPECGCKGNREFAGCLKLDFVIEPL